MTVARADDDGSIAIAANDVAANPLININANIGQLQFMAQQVQFIRDTAQKLKKKRVGKGPIGWIRLRHDYRNREGRA